MKHFFRTIAGKAILFVTCILSVFILAASIASAVVMFEEGFYESSEETMFGRIASHRILPWWLNKYTYNDYATEDGVRIYNTDSNLIITATDKDGRLIAKTSNAGQERVGGERRYTFEATMTRLNEYDYSYLSWHCRQIRNNNDGYRLEFTYHYPESPTAQEYETLIIQADFVKGMPANDEFQLIDRLIHFGYGLRYSIYAIGAAAALLALICFIGLMCVSARRPEDDELHPGLLNRVPSDVVFLVVFGLITLYIGVTADMFSRDVEATIVLIILCPFAMALFLGWCMGFAARLKQHTLLKNTLTGLILVYLWKCIKWLFALIRRAVIFLAGLIREIPTVWKVPVVLAVDALFNIFCMALVSNHASDEAIVFMIFKTLLLLGVCIYLFTRFRVLEQGAQALAEGKFDYKVDTSRMLTSMRRHGENLNSIANGIQIAVEERLKSERMKTELITNVSHDIKTPLTSIINYVGLIAKEDCDNEKHAEYCEVLMRQSGRLKKLIEDLVEASKASTGNLDVNPVPCDASVFLTQASGEYEEKLNSAGLTLIVKEPGEKLTIMADGRRMWRIFDNLMNNICKYSMPGTRVYLSLEKDGNTARFLFKNTSKEVLDISEEELMERFVRGDSSRNTEGNGLGLSIAKSMAQLQNGDLRLETDGDLFKAILTFPIVSEI